MLWRQNDFFFSWPKPYKNPLKSENAHKRVADGDVHLQRRIKGRPIVITLVSFPWADLFSQFKCHQISCKELGWIPDKQPGLSTSEWLTLFPKQESELRKHSGVNRWLEFNHKWNKMFQNDILNTYSLCLLFCKSVFKSLWKHPYHRHARRFVALLFYRICTISKCVW